MSPDLEQVLADALAAVVAAGGNADPFKGKKETVAATQAMVLYTGLNEIRNAILLIQPGDTQALLDKLEEIRYDMHRTR